MAQVQPPVLINEFLAVNVEGLTANDGEAHDWVELHNSSNSAVDLAGWTLQIGNDQHVFASETMAPGGYLIVFASGDAGLTTAGELHLGAKLSGDGESLVLADPSGAVSTPSWPIAYPAQVGDVSYGISPAGTLGFFSTPTPGAPNGQGNDGVVAPVDFSVAHGLYSAPISVVLSSATSRATMRYTLDGQTPTASVGSTLAAGQSLTVSSTTTLRAVAMRSGWITSPVRTQTYIFTADVITQPETTPPGWPADPAPPTNQRMVYGMDPQLVNGNEAAMQASLAAIPTLSVVTDLPNLFDPSTGIYVNARNKGRDWEAPISLELIDPSGQEPGFSVEGGLRIRGASTRSQVYAKHNLGLFFREEYGGVLDYPLFGGEGTSEFKKVDLRSAQGVDWSRFADAENTIMRELWHRDTQAAMGHPYTRTRYYHLYINGQYWGVFLTQERVGDHYGESYFGGRESDYDVLKHDYNAHPVTGEWPSKRYLATDGDGVAWESLHPLVIDQIVDDAEFATLEAQVDLVSLADYYLLHIWSGVTDGAPDPGTGGRSNNWFALRNRTGQGPAGKWQFFHHDAEGSLCLRDSTDTDQSTPWDLTSGGYLDAEYMAPPWLHQALLSHDSYRQIFIDRVALHTAPGAALDPASAIARWDSRVAEVEGAIDAHAARWGDADGSQVARTKADWLAAIDAVRDCFVARASIAQAQLTADGLWPNANAPALNPAGGAVAFASTVTISGAGANAETWYTLDGSDPRGIDGLPSPTALLYSGPILITTDVTLQSRVLDAGSWSPLAEGTYSLAAPPDPPRLLVNEFNAVSGSKYLGGGGPADMANGTDSTFGRTAGNGGDWFELVVLEDGLDIRGWSVEVSHLDGGVRTPSAQLTFTNNAALASLRAGTLITVSEDVPDDLSYAPWAGDWHLNIQSNDAGDGALVTASSESDFVINNDDTQIALFDATGAIEALPTGEGSAPNASVSSTEVFKLEAPPTSTITPADPEYRDGTSSTWGLANRFDDVQEQDLSSLRVTFGDVDCNNTVNLLDARNIAQYAIGIRAAVSSCPLGNAATDTYTPAGDVDGSGTVSLLDARFVALCSIGVANQLCP